MPAFAGNREGERGGGETDGWPAIAASKAAQPPPLILSRGLQPAKSKDPPPRWPNSGAFDKLRLSGGGGGF